jgi:hypothetical protein
MCLFCYPFGSTKQVQAGMSTVEQDQGNCRAFMLILLSLLAVVGMV